MQQVAVLANMASPESLLSLTEGGAQLQENISAVRGMIVMKREEVENLTKLRVIKSEALHFQGAVQKIQDSPPKKSDFSNIQGPEGQTLSQIFSKELHEKSSDHEDFLKDLQNFRHLVERIKDNLKKLQQSDDTQKTDTQYILAKMKERLQGLQVKIKDA